MNKSRFLSILSTLLITAGIILLFLPRITSFWIGNKASQNAESTEQVSAETMQENIKKESSFDFDAIEEISPSGIWGTFGPVDESLIVGRLYIPSIELNLTVYNGVTNQILHAGLGTMRPDLTMGEGNFPIAGHYSRYGNTLFSKLTDVKIGDEIYLTDNDKIYEYHVYDTKIVEPSEVEWIDPDVAKEHGKPVISLMNCYFVEDVNTGDRFFVFGELVDVYDYE